MGQPSKHNSTLLSIRQLFYGSSLSFPCDAVPAYHLRNSQKHYNENVLLILLIRHLPHFVSLLYFWEHLQHVIQRREIHLQQFVQMLMVPGYYNCYHCHYRCYLITLPSSDGYDV